ncbi:MAG: methyltransferase domain-containing protein [Flavobacteriaceae bacterium]|nr:methyltransferase domain-containing protein [Flavobacteriaceae bacterium]
MISYASKYRSSEEEIMDNFNLQGEQLELLLSDLSVVNSWLGGNSITLGGIQKLLNKFPKKESLTIIDVGCGDGEMLRRVHEAVNNESKDLELKGLDANEHILHLANSKSEAFKNITFQKVDITKDLGAIPPFDIALCTLFLHHLDDDDIIFLLNKLIEKARMGIIINDLHRSKWAFHLFKIFSRIAIKTDIAKHDGLVSIARAFKKHELLKIAKKIDGHHSIRWKWAFRFQWIITK